MSNRELRDFFIVAVVRLGYLFLLEYLIIVAAYSYQVVEIIVR